jgi:hypothetical protein
MTESSPVSGVEIRKAEVAAFDAPFFDKVTAVGITEHEQSGNGTPANEALKIELRFFLPKWLRIQSIGIAI